MGDRANVEIKDKDSDSVVYLYTHWDGTELPKTVQKALARKLRWDDSYYLARIVFCEMIKGRIKSETGFGISSVVGDGDDRIITLENCEVRINDGLSYTFKDYLNLKNPSWED